MADPKLLTEAEAHDRLIAEGYANDNRRQEAIDAMKLLGMIAPEPPVDPLAGEVQALLCEWGVTVTEATLGLTRAALSRGCEIGLAERPALTRERVREVVGRLRVWDTANPWNVDSLADRLHAALTERDQ